MALSRDNVRRIKKNLSVYDAVPAREDIFGLIDLAERYLDNEASESYDFNQFSRWDEGSGG